MIPRIHFPYCLATAPSLYLICCPPGSPLGRHTTAAVRLPRCLSPREWKRNTQRDLKQHRTRRRKGHVVAVAAPSPGQRVYAGAARRGAKGRGGPVASTFTGRRD